MLGVLLLILKIIAIIIGVLLGLALLIIMAVLFVPVRYRINASFYEKPIVNVKISWLLKLIRFNAIYDDNGFRIKCMVFFVKLKKISADGLKESDELKESDGLVFPENVEETNDMLYVDDISADNWPPDGHFFNNIEATKGILSQEEDDKDESELSEQICKDEEGLEKNKRKKSLLKCIRKTFRQLIKKIKSIFKKICDIIRAIRNKSISIKNLITEKIKKITDILNNSDYRELAQFLLGQLKEILKKIKPKKYRIDIRFGFEDSYTTGKVLMYVAMFYGLLGIDAKITPEFNQEIFEGEIYLKGRVQIISLIIIGLRVYNNELFKKLVIDRK